MFAEISAIPVTPFDPDGAVDEAALQAVVARIVGSGIGLVVACGNTGEYSSLTSAESERVAALTIEAASSAMVLVGVGGDIETAAREARAGIERGAVGAMIHYPPDPYISDAGLLRYYERLIDEIDGVVVPYVRGRGLPATVLERIIEMEKVVAVKYAVPDLLRFGDFARVYGSSVTLLCGLAEIWTPFFWMLGARGFTSGLVNVAPELSLEMLQALREGDYPGAMRVWEKLRPFEEMRARAMSANNVSVVKDAMELRGLLATGAVRPPIASLDETGRAELSAVLASWE